MLKISSAVQPEYVNAGGKLITLKAKFPEYGDEVFTLPVSSLDYDPYGRELYARAMAGEYGPIAPYVAPVPPPPTQAQINAAADREMQRLSIAAVPLLIEQMAASATGQAKADLLQIDAQIKAERAKKK